MNALFNPSSQEKSTAVIPNLVLAFFELVADLFVDEVATDCSSSMIWRFVVDVDAAFVVVVVLCLVGVTTADLVPCVDSSVEVAVEFVKSIGWSVPSLVLPDDSGTVVWTIGAVASVLGSTVDKPEREGAAARTVVLVRRGMMIRGKEG